VLQLSGHRYGSTLVPFAAEDKEAMKYKTQKCFKMLGFTKAENVCSMILTLFMYYLKCAFGASALMLLFLGTRKGILSTKIYYNRPLRYFW